MRSISSASVSCLASVISRCVTLDSLGLKAAIALSVASGFFSGCSLIRYSAPTLLDAQERQCAELHAEIDTAKDQASAAWDLAGGEREDADEAFELFIKTHEVSEDDVDFAKRS